MAAAMPAVPWRRIVIVQHRIKKPPLVEAVGADEKGVDAAGCRAYQHVTLAPAQRHQRGEAGAEVAAAIPSMAGSIRHHPPPRRPVAGVILDHHQPWPPAFNR